jgi:hypothetical protein
MVAETPTLGPPRVRSDWAYHPSTRRAQNADIRDLEASDPRGVSLRGTMDHGLFSPMSDPRFGLDQLPDKPSLRVLRLQEAADARCRLRRPILTGSSPPVSPARHAAT